MFGRKNQTILSSHYGKLVEQDEAPEFDTRDGDDDEDFFSLKRADHDLPADLAEHSDISKRKIRMMKSKKALAKVYEFKDVKDVDVEGDGTDFVRKEIGKMQRADVDDKAAAKEKKREKKRKRKEREREERDDNGGYAGPAIAPPSDDDGYVSPTFDLPTESEDERAHFSAPPKKKSRKGDKPPTTLEEEEELALKLLRR